MTTVGGTLYVEICEMRYLFQLLFSQMYLIGSQESCVCFITPNISAGKNSIHMGL